MHLREAPFRIILPFFTFVDFQRSSAVMDQIVQGLPPAFANIFVLADYVQIHCRCSKVDDLLQSCQINLGKLLKHVQSLKHMPWRWQGQIFMLTKQRGSVKALLPFSRTFGFWGYSEIARCHSQPQASMVFA